MQERTGPLPWDDLRTVLAIAQARSLSGAARTLQVEHSTVFRRLESIESRLGVALFERSRSGYLANAHGEVVAEAARSIEETALAAERRVLGADTRLTGSVRIATTEMFSAYLLPGALRGFLTAHSEIEIEVVVSNRAVDLTRREADLALRSTNSPPDYLIGRQIGVLRYAVFAARGLLRGRKASRLQDFPWIGFDERIADLEIARWLREELPGIKPRLRFDSLPAMMRAATAGLGAAALPVFAASQQPSLVRLTDILERPRVGLWILRHRDLRDSARVRALAQHLARSVPEVLNALQDREGRPRSSRRRR